MPFEKFNQRVDMTGRCVPGMLAAMAIDATYIDSTLFRRMPQGGGEGEQEICFFRTRLLRPEYVESAYSQLGLEFASPSLVIAANEDCALLRRTNPNIGYWRDDGKLCFIAFRAWEGTPTVEVGRADRPRQEFWWHVGVPVRRSA